MSRLVYSSPDDGFWDTLVVLSLSEDSETLWADDEKRPAEDEPAAPPAERSPPRRRPG